MKPINPKDPRIKALAKRCSKTKRGVSCATLMAETGMGRSLCQGVLRQCGIQGLLVLYKVPGGEWCWMSRADHLEILADVSSARRIKRREQGKNTYRQRRESGLIDTYNRIVDPPDWPIKRSYIKAGDAPPPVTYAANSVFALGAA